MKAYEGPVRAVLIDVGTKDDFLEKQLKPEAFAEAARGNSNIKLQLRLQARTLPAFCCSTHSGRLHGAWHAAR